MIEKEKEKEIYKACMLIGNRFIKKYDNDVTDEWSASEECATITRLTYEMMSTINISMERALDIIMENIIENGFRHVEDHGWDLYVRGFIAGEVLGMPTENNMEKAYMADKLWNNDDEGEYGYYQEVLEKVKEKK